MYHYRMRNDRNTREVFEKQLNLLIDEVKEQTEYIRAIPTLKDEELQEYTDEFCNRVDKINTTIKKALVDFLAETVGWINEFSHLTEATGHGGAESEGGDWIQELFDYPQYPAEI